MDGLYLTRVALYIGFCCAAAKTVCLRKLPLSPSQPRCVFIAYDKVTCEWTPGKNSPADTVYTLEANINKNISMTGSADIIAGQRSSCTQESELSCLDKGVFLRTKSYCDSPGKPAFSCRRTRETHCSDHMSSPDRLYSVRVTAHSAEATADSPTLCIRALDAVKLRKPVLSDLRPVRDEPGCVELQWHIPVRFALTHQDICSRLVNYQLQYSTDDQPEAQTVEGYLAEHLERLQCEVSLKTNRTVRLRSPCSLSPFTQYTVRLRQRYGSIWSEWSNQIQSCTGMAAPVTAPHLWRKLKPTDDPQKRHVTLLWKSPARSEKACTSLWFNVYCQSEESHSALQTESCLNMTSTSCQLTLNMERSSCFLTMCNSAGCSPAARLTLPAPTDTPLRAVKTVSVKALNDSSLEVTWSTLTHSSLTGFLLEWESVTKNDKYDLRWERLNQNTGSIIITDLLSEVRYTVTVRPDFGSEPGEAASTQAYTRQGVPSAGPRLHVKEQSNSAVLVVWEPPPVKEQHGFIIQYSLYCQQENNATGEVHTVSGETLSYHLTGLSGVYQIYMTAHTVAGEGPASAPQWVTVEGDYLDKTILVYGLLPVFMVFLFLIIIACRQRIKQNIWPSVPDPAHSSLTAWISNSKRTTKNFYPEGVHHTSTSELINELNDEDC